MASLQQTIKSPQNVEFVIVSKFDRSSLFILRVLLTSAPGALFKHTKRSN